MFQNRLDAAQALINPLSAYRHHPEGVILAIPRGGLEIGHALSQSLHLPLDVILTKKIGYPGNKEFAIGSVSLKSLLIDPPYLETFSDYIADEAASIRALLKKRYQAYLGDRLPISLQDKRVILTDDGVATGNTLFSAIDLVKQESPQEIIVAIPVSPPDTLLRLKDQVDTVICLLSPHHFQAVGQFYEDFRQVDDQEAIRLLRDSHAL